MEFVNQNAQRYIKNRMVVEPFVVTILQNGDIFVHDYEESEENEKMPKKRDIMKIIQEIPERNIIKLIPENLDDLWHLSHIIQPYNAIYAVTERRTEDKGDKLRADRGTKRRVFLGIKAEKINFHEDFNRLRVSGKIIHAPDDIPIGSYHTIDIEPFLQVSVQKNWKKWDIERLKEAEDSSKKAKSSSRYYG